MTSTPFPLIYRLFHVIQVIIHSASIYAGSPNEPFVLTLHAKRCVINNTCSSCVKENRGFDLYRLITGTECTGVQIACQRHPGYYGDGLLHGPSGGQRKTNPVVTSVTGLMQVYHQMKMSLVELKNVIDQDVHSTRVSSRLYGTAEDDKEENAEEDKEKKRKKQRHNEQEGDRMDENEPLLLSAEWEWECGLSIERW